MQQDDGDAVLTGDGDDVQQDDGTALWTPLGFLKSLRLKREKLNEHLQVCSETGIMKDAASDSG